MFLIEKKFRFEASHQLPQHDGRCRRNHGHSWVMTLGVVGRKLVEDGPKVDMLVDYGDVSRVTQSLLDNYLDHWHLNETTGLTNPTSEALAEWVYNRLAPIIRMLRAGETQEDLIELAWVRIEETCTSACTYYPTIEEDKEAPNSKHRNTTRAPGVGKDLSMSKAKRYL